MKVLIAAPVGGFKQYSVMDWFNWISTQTQPDCDVCVCVNGKDTSTIAQMFKDTTINEKPIIVLELPQKELTTIQNITYSREMIRRYAVDNNYDYIFFLDTDTIPAHHYAIKRLMRPRLDCVSGLYFYKNTKQPVIIDKDTHTNIRLDKCSEAVDKEELIEVWGFGFGCLLLSRKAFEKNAFDYELFGEERTDDFGYCHVLEQAGIKRWFDPFVICKHLVDPSLKPSSETGTRIPFTIKQV